MPFLFDATAMTPQEVAEQLERLKRAGWQMGDYHLKHEPLWRRFVRAFQRRT